MSGPASNLKFVVMYIIYLIYSSYYHIIWWCADVISTVGSEGRARFVASFTSVSGHTSRYRSWKRTGCGSRASKVSRGVVEHCWTICVYNWGHVPLTHTHNIYIYLIGSMYAIYGNIYHQYTPNVSIYTIHGSYGYRYRYNVGYRWWSQWEIRTGESGNLYTESCFTCHVRSDRSLTK